MVNYQNGKIYKIVSSQTEEIYIGSTVEKYLSARLNGHRQKVKRNENVGSQKILQYDDAKIILIENYSCNSKDELLSREQYWIDDYKQKGIIIVNIYNAHGVDKEKEKKTAKMIYEKKKEILFTKLDCVCGGKYTPMHKKTHEKTKMHMTYLETI